MDSARRWCCSRNILTLLFAGSIGIFLLSLSPEEDPPLPVNLSYIPASYLPVSDPEPRGDFNVLAIPLKRSGRLLLIEAIIDGVQGNLVFDTGATGLVLNRTYFRKHALHESGSPNGITGAANSLGSTVVEKIQVSDLYFTKLRADLTDLSHIENRMGVKIIGLFGFNMIRTFETTIDAAKGELLLCRVDRKGDRLEAPETPVTPDFTQKIDPWNPVLILKGQIGGKTLSFCFDTGAETNVLDSHVHKNVLSTIDIVRRSELRGAGQASQEVLFGTMKDFSLENLSIPGMETIIVNLDALSQAYGVHIDGMLGYGFLQQGILTINLVKKQFGMKYRKES